jgi:2-hydroxycyclohexanecarboxyl-CoA dehydrogenase
MSSSAQEKRVALVTGAARGIGRGIAQELAAQDHTVVIGDILADEAAQTAGEIGGHSIHLDVTDTAAVKSAVEELQQRLGAIDILVNNAGWDEFRRFVDTEEPFWDQVIELNFKGCLRTCRYVVPGMIERGYGRVVNIGSDAARVGSSLESVYSGAKGAVVAFTKTLAREVARSGVTANAVCPGPTETPMLQQIAASGEDSTTVLEAMRRAVPMRRLGQPEDIAAAVAFLASDRAGFITGQTLSVSGGLTMA